MNLPDFLTLWPNDEIVLTGHRIGLYSIIDQFQRGRSRGRNPPREFPHFGTRPD